MNRRIRSRSLGLFLSLLLMMPATVFCEGRAAVVNLADKTVLSQPTTDVGQTKDLKIQDTKSEAAAQDDGWTEKSEVTQKEINITAGNSQVLRLKHKIGRISVSNPDVADVVILDSNEILINTKEKGAANLILWDEDGKILVYNLIVTTDPNPLKEALRKIDPEGTVEVLPTQKGFVVRGNVESVKRQDQIANAAKAFSNESVSLVTVNDAKQVLLEIRFIEVSRSTGFDFGVDGYIIGKRFGLTFLGGGTGSALSGNGVTTGLQNVASSPFQFQALDDSAASTLITSGFTDKNIKINDFIKALEEKTKTKLIARPNLLVRDGEKASFLVGGEYPVPTVTQNTIDIQYKEYGTKLIYKPEIITKDTLRLTIETEMSQLDFANGVTVNNFLIPALTARRTTSVVDLETGSSLLISGLIQQRKVETESGTPFLRKIPLLGRIFESTDNSYQESELIVIITPRIMDTKGNSFKVDRLSTENPLKQAMDLEKHPFRDKKAAALEKAVGYFEQAPSFQIPDEIMIADEKNTALIPRRVLSGVRADNDKNPSASPAAVPNSVKAEASGTKTGSNSNSVSGNAATGRDKDRNRLWPT